MEASLQRGKSNYFLLIGTVFLRFFGDSLFYAFLARYLKTLPFLSWQLSVLTMAIPIMGMLGSAFLAFFGSTTKRRRHIYLGLFSLECLVVAFFGFRDEFWYVLLFDMIANFCTGPSFSIIDTFIVGATDRAKKTYASARRFGTLGYIVGVIGGGYLISFLSDKWTFFIGGCLMLTASILFLVLRFDQKDEELARTREEKPNFFRNFGALMHIKNYLLFLFAFSLAEGMYLATDTAFSLFTVDLGIEDHIFGYAFGGAIIVEFIIMLFFRKSFGRKKMKWALLLGAISQILRPALFAIPFDYPYVYLFFEFLHGVSVGFFLAALLPYLREIVGEELLYPAFFFFGLLRYTLTAAMNFAVPLMADSVGYSPVFWILAGGSLLGFLLILPIRLEEPIEEAA